MFTHEITAQLLENLAGIKVCPQTIWNWVQEKGQQAMEELASELKAMKDGFPPITEPLCDAVAQMTLAIAADGVMVPFRFREKTPSCQTQWREVKVAVLALIRTSSNP